MQVEQRIVAQDEGGLRLDRWFRRHFPQLGHGRLEKLLRTGQVRLEGKRAKTSDRVEVGQTIRVPPIPAEAIMPKRKQPDSISEKDVEFIRSLVIHTEPDLFVLNKPPGLAVQGGSKTTRHIDGLLPGLAVKGAERPCLVHRLDRDTSGVLIIARSRSSAADLGKLFRSRDLEKRYWALTVGQPVPHVGVIDMPLLKAGGRGAERMEVSEDDDFAQEAVTEYETVAGAASKFAWLALKPITGRTHQLRVHLAAIGHPIVGDSKYGGMIDAGLEIPNQLHLHAREITLPRGRQKKLRLTAPLPSHMAQTWRFFGFSESEADG